MSARSFAVFMAVLAVVGLLAYGLLKKSSSSLAVGDPVPDARIWLGPQEPVQLHDVLSEGPVLLLFYLFDWSST